MAVALVDARGRISWWSRAAGELLGWNADEVVGTAARDLLGPHAPSQARFAGSPRARLARLRHRSGRLVEAEVRILAAQDGGETLLLAVPPSPSPSWDDVPEIATTLIQQDLVGVALLDLDLRLVRTNPAFRSLRPADGPEDWVLSLHRTGTGESARDAIAAVAERGVPVVAAEFRGPVPGSEPALSLTCLRVLDRRGEPVGVAVAAGEITDRFQAQSRRTAAYRGAVGIGGSLDAVNSAQDLVQALVPALGDLAAVDLRDDVLEGRDPPAKYIGPEDELLRRVAVKSADRRWPAPLVQVGESLPPIPDRPEFQRTAVGQEVIVSDPELVRLFLGNDPVLVAKMMPEGMRSSLGCPIYHRGRVLGYALVWRTTTPVPFDERDAQVLKDLCVRSAQAVNNALRYTREHRTAVALQQSLLPASTTDSTAAETSGIYLPIGGGASVGGDWFDTFALSSLRVALVVGDVIGHGLQATTTMARLRTAVQTLADLDLSPDELLTRLDDLVRRMEAEAELPDTVGASCLFAVYDPVSGICQVASAGHPPPAVVLPDGTVTYLDIEPGPPLGVVDSPFEVYTCTLPPGSVLALYTDGLLGRDVDAGMTRLREDLTELCRPGDPLHEIGTAVIGRHPEAEGPEDDVTLLLARIRSVPAADTAVWEYPAEPTAVHDARQDVTAQLIGWGLEEQLFATELVVSELVTNALRYAGGPIVLRLIRDRVLVCEVSDPKDAHPRLRRARSTDEGGRGLFLVAQLTSRWGCRFSPRGKTIWTEQELAPRSA
ncbi:SpoIIE family protein phosphatase [Streptomyces sp. NK15101]|uniref:SpoIIE family protein phosphatase n=1 Tax=Streptomyces sp. NK15101 TaxID=2873261 RepID=UPI001CEC7E99|nr:SpoIIE family protein phosphatase [Streptomyces sp. NK15101]